MASNEMCVYCFDSLIHHLEGSPNSEQPSFTNDSFPLFVTWNKESKRSGDVSLRGCIGTFKAKNLHAGLREYAVTSAIQDRRFSPVTASEVSQLHVAVSLLMNFEDVDDVWDWDIDENGIWIDFVDPQGISRNATYLPEVAGEQGWTKQEAMESLIRKAGYKGPVNEALLKKIRLTRYTSSKYSLSYADYAAYKRSRGQRI